jgi:hypothetical protein
MPLIYKSQKCLLKPFDHGIVEKDARYSASLWINFLVMKSLKNKCELTDHYRNFSYSLFY